MDWGRAEGCQAGGQKTAPGHGREPQGDGLGGKQGQSEPFRRPAPRTMRAQSLRRPATAKKPL